jgi:EPS-associated MarR family transcriptional regulator
MTKPEADKPNTPTDEPTRRADRLNDDLQLQALRLLQAEPALSQRDLARALGISLGRTNYCMRALIDQGWIKIQNFRNSRNKLAYLYLLTPQGIDAKARITARFLQRKEAEYAALQAEIARLRAEVSAQGQTEMS